MKVLFLDHDGVICLKDNWGSRFTKQNHYGKKMSQSIRSLPVEVRFDDFDKDAVTVLNEILTETDAEIVVSSDWKRYADVDELGEYYEQSGIIKKPIDTTPFFNDVEVPEGYKWTYSEKVEQERSLEILQWLKEHPEVTHWVSVDDLHMGILTDTISYGMVERDWGLENFVWTPHPKEGIKENGVKEKIIDILNK